MSNVANRILSELNGKRLLFRMINRKNNVQLVIIFCQKLPSMTEKFHVPCAVRPTPRYPASRLCPDSTARRVFLVNYHMTHIAIDNIQYYTEGGFYYLKSITVINGITIPKYYSSNEQGATAGFVHYYLYGQKTGGSRWDADMSITNLFHRRP